MTTANKTHIVVGVDGSEPSKQALRWALHQAELTGATAEAVIAWECPVTNSWAYVNFDEEAEAKAATETLTEAINDVIGPEWPKPLRATVTEGNSARVLLDAAAHADLLVVGSRGHGGFAEVLLGSISLHCVNHATCPVVVIRDQKHPTAD